MHGGRFYSIDKELKHLQLFSQCKWIVQCYGHTHIGNDHLIVMEASPYGDLGKVVRGNKARSYLDSKQGLGLLLRWMYEVASGVEYMHRLFVRHGDLKPANILVFDNLHVKIADLGWSRKSLDIERYAHSANCAGLIAQQDNDNIPKVLSSDQKSYRTTASNFVGGGTPGYMPPEQVLGQRVTLSGDMFSFGATWLHVINGSNESTFDDAKKRCLELYEKHWCEEVNDMLKLLEKCLSSEPRDRLEATECVEMVKMLSSKIDLSDEELECVTSSLVRNF